MNSRSVNNITFSVITINWHTAFPLDYHFIRGWGENIFRFSLMNNNSFSLSVFFSMDFKALVRMTNDYLIVLILCLSTPFDAVNHSIDKRPKTTKQNPTQDQINVSTSKNLIPSLFPTSWWLSWILVSLKVGFEALLLPSVLCMCQMIPYLEAYPQTRTGMQKKNPKTWEC